MTQTPETTNTADLPTTAAIEPIHITSRTTPHTPPVVDEHDAFYWQLSPAALAELRETDLIFEEEGYLAHEINWGRRILGLRGKYVPVPDVDPNWEPPHIEHFSDAIAAILQAATEAGLNAHDLATEGLRTHRLAREEAADSKCRPWNQSRWCTED